MREQENNGNVAPIQNPDEETGCENARCKGKERKKVPTRGV